ncbi:MAG TPA: FAD:protein FMN transferase, partial [Gemmatimonadaceae bacterium]
MSAYIHRFAMMGTVVTIEVVSDEQREREAAVERAVGWFRHVEARCNRFDPSSEIARLAHHVGAPTPVSETVFEAIQFALAVARETDGAFDPTIGLRMESRGFDRDYRSGAVVHTSLAASRRATYRDVELDADRRTVTLHEPLLLDLGAVAKGLAVDMAARELAAFENFAIDAGGDLYVAGHNAAGVPWSVGIRHPRLPDALIETLHVSNVAVCTSGDYERRARGEHHILDPRSDEPAALAASVSVVAPLAMVADALATAAFVLGPDRGLALLERHGVQGLIV